MKPELIVFDLNKTLINENSWLDLNLAMGVTQEEDNDLMARASRGELTDQEGQNELFALYRSRNADLSKSAIKEILLRYTFLDGVREVITELGHRGYQLALLSGSIDLLVEHVAEELSIPTWRASNHFIFENDQLAAINSVEKDNVDKLTQLTEICNKLAIPLDQCLVVGDGANDEELFKATGNGVTFTGSPIKDRARYVISSLNDVLSIVD